eukprot:Nitzschia sp. Nitz4//scaffold35_size145790//53677//57308//NITZ4_003021-RA/size145790-augustus-gene-0.134-mRNA-1//-1//CDS//3329549097//6150//frame0
MASSRWKRFPFFERHTLSLASEVLENIIPIGGSEGKGSRRSVSALDRAASEALDDSVSLVVTTAALPYNSKPEQGSADVEGENAALVGMWSSLNVCCSALEPAGLDNTTILLPSQAQNFEDDSNVKTSTTAVDGLVLVFASSQETDYVHCFDVTVRCNPPDSPQKDLEDMDGWRGYFAPLKSRKRKPPQLPGPTTLEDRVISDHMTQESVEGIVGIATCRATTGHRPLHMACISSTNLVVVVDPHLYLSCSRRPLATPDKLEAQVYELATEWNETKDGNATSVDIVSGIVAVGTDKGSVHIFTYGGGKQYLRPYLTIPAPPSGGLAVASCRLSLGADAASVFVAYRRSSTVTSPRGSAAGVCCYDMPVPTPAAVPISAPSARHDLDGRQVPSPTLCDAVSSSDGALFTVARPDGLYTYSTTQKVDVAPIDGSKLAVCVIPPRESPGTAREPAVKKAGSSFALVASTDAKSRRDAVDIYDATNKLVAFHFLLSPGHTAIRADGVTTLPTRAADGSLRSGKSSAVIFTSGGSLVTLTEKPTTEKVNLLVQKNLFSAAIFVAYADPSFEVAEITSLYRKHAEYLYRKGDYAAAIDQYINTIGSLEPSHVIFRYLDAPKIPLLVKYLEELRARELTTAVHNELLRTCYLKLNDSESAEAIAAFTSSAMDTESLSSVVTSSPKNALAMICSFEAPQAAEALVVHGASLARLLPRETAGLAVTLCLGTFSPSRFSESGSVLADAKKVLERAIDDSERVCDPYPVHLFASSFMENTKMLRLLLSHCNRNKCTLTPSLRRTLLELTLAEWNQAKRSGDTEVEKLRRKEAIAALTDSHSRDIGDYDALVIVQLAGFEEGELLLYERLQMGPMLLSRYAKDGSEKARRQMLAMCQSDPEILADVLGHFVAMVSENMNSGQNDGESDDDQSDDEDREILLDIQEALSLARQQGILPPVRIARILAGEGTSQFSSGEAAQDMPQHRTIPLSVALDYVGDVLDDSRKEILRLKSEVEEYNQLCNSMEVEIENLLKTTRTSPSTKAEEVSPRINIEDMYTKVRNAADEGEKPDSTLDLTREAFWREMEQTEDSFQTISRFFAKGVIQ